LEAALGPRDQHDVSALGGVASGDRRADAAGGAGDEGDTPGEAAGGHSRSDDFFEKRELRVDRAFLVVEEARRIVAGEAGVAELRLRGVAPILAHRAVEPVDRNERQAVDADVAGHAWHVEA